MTGGLPGQVVTQAETLRDLFAREGYTLTCASAHPNRWVRWLDVLSTLLRAARRIDIQCLQVFGGPIFVVEDSASLLGKLLGQRVIMVLRGGAMPDFMRRYPRWTRRVLGRADVLVTPSNFLARAVRERGFAVEVIPNVIDSARYPFRLRERVRPRLFWMRAFHDIYNPEMAIRVLARLRAIEPEATLIMGGQDKGLLPGVQQLARELGVADAVEFPGYLDFERKVKFASASDIYLNTNRIDNMPVSVVEMGALGVPVIATNIGGIPDLLTHEENGLLVADNDVEAMVQAVVRLVREPALARKLSVNGRVLADRSSWASVRAQWENVFERLMPARGAGGRN